MPHSVAMALAVSMLSPGDSDDDDDCNDDDNDDDDHHYQHHHLVLIHNLTIYLSIYLSISLTGHHANEYPRPLALSDGLFDIWSQRILSCHEWMNM